MSMPCLVFFGPVDPSFAMPETAEEAYAFLSSRTHEASPFLYESLYQCTSNYGWIQAEVTRFCDQQSITGLEFVRLRPEYSIAPDSYLLCASDMTNALKAVEEIAAILHRGQAHLNTRTFPDDREYGQDFDEAQPILKLQEWDVRNPTSTFLKSLAAAMHETITARKCLLYMTLR